MYQEDQLFPTAVLLLKRFLNTCIFLYFPSCILWKMVGLIWLVLKDAGDFLKKIKCLGKIPEGAILVTADAVGLYPNNPHDLGLQFLRKRLNETAIGTKYLLKR